VAIQNLNILWTHLGPGRADPILVIDAYTVVDHYLRVCEVRNEEPQRPFSGKLNLRRGPDLHRAAAVAAAAEGESLNAWLTKLVESAAAPMVVRERPPTTRGRVAARDRTEGR